MRTQPIKPEEGDGEPEGSKLKRSLTIVDLIAYGLAATVGAGIFVVTGVVAKDNAGPAIVFSFLTAAISSLFSAFCYSEFAARIPVSGSAYTFSYVALGELVGWLIGWNLTLEYSISASAVARGWAGYIVSFIEVVFKTKPPAWLHNYKLFASFSLSPLAVIIIVLCVCVLLFGAKESAMFNVVMTVLNIIVILFIIGLGSTKVDTYNWEVFFPFGFQGVFRGAGLVFFSYIGFDSVTTLAGEVKNPKRDLPIGIVGTLGVVTLLYIAVSLVVTGMVPYYELNADSPLSTSFSDVGYNWAAAIVAAGSVTTLTATTLASLLGQPRIFYQMAQDGLLWKFFGQLNSRQIPVWATIISGLLSGLLAFIFDLGTLSYMISLGTLLAFCVVCGGVIILRYREQSHKLDSFGVDSIANDNVELREHAHLDSYLSCLEPIARATLPCVPLLVMSFFVFSIVFSLSFKLQTDWWAKVISGVPLLIIYFLLQILRPKDIPKTFTCPLVPLIPMLGMLINIYLIVELPVDAIYRVLIWSLIGLLIYFVYGIRNSKLNKKLA